MAIMNEVKHNAEITLVAHQNDELTTRVNTNGIITFTGKGIFIEFPLEDNNITTFGLSEGTVTITKLGVTAYTLVLDEGKKHHFVMETLYGDLELTVTAERVYYFLQKPLLNFELEYVLSSAAWEDNLRQKIELKCRIGGVIS